MVKIEVVYEFDDEHYSIGHMKNIYFAILNVHYAPNYTKVTFFHKTEGKVSLADIYKMLKSLETLDGKRVSFRVY